MKIISLNCPKCGASLSTEDNRMFFFFNHKDIVRVIHRGYENDEFQAMKSMILNYCPDNSFLGEEK